jgi:hypothetical protein
MPTNINGNSGIDRIQDGSVHNVDIDSVDFSKIVGDSSSVGLIRQWKMTSSPTQNIAITAAAGTTGATSGTYTGAEIAMTPKDINSWFRVHWDTCCDDTGGGGAATGAGGVGIILSMHTPTTGWVRVRDSGSHAFYYNAMADEYFRPALDTVVKAVNTEEHKFRIYMKLHTTVRYRINIIIANSLYSNGWKNNHFEVQELNGATFNNGNYT